MLAASINGGLAELAKTHARTFGSQRAKPLPPHLSKARSLRHHLLQAQSRLRRALVDARRSCLAAAKALGWLTSELVAEMRGAGASRL